MRCSGDLDLKFTGHTVHQIHHIPVVTGQARYILTYNCRYASKRDIPMLLSRARAQRTEWLLIDCQVAWFIWFWHAIR